MQDIVHLNNQGLLRAHIDGTMIRSRLIRYLAPSDTPRRRNAHRRVPTKPDPIPLPRTNEAKIIGVNMFHLGSNTNGSADPPESTLKDSIVAAAESVLKDDQSIAKPDCLAHFATRAADELVRAAVCAHLQNVENEDAILLQSIRDKIVESQKAALSEVEKCSVCYDELTDKDLIVFPCGHCIHEECRRLMENERNDERSPPCPLCNAVTPLYFDTETHERLSDEDVMIRFEAQRIAATPEYDGDADERGRDALRLTELFRAMDALYMGMEDPQPTVGTTRVIRLTDLTGASRPNDLD